MTTPAIRDTAGDAAARYRQFVTLRDQLAPKATDDELGLFAQVCAHLDLDPFADQIVLVGRWDSRVGREVHRHQVTVAGRRAIAERTGELVGIVGPQWCGPRDENGGALVWHDVWDDNDRPPYCARVLVHRRGWVEPANGTAKWSEFAQTNRDGKLLPVWAQMPSHMLGKVAESMALRRAFPDVITADLVGAGGAYGGVDDAGDLAELLEASGAAPVSVTGGWDTDDAGPDLDDAIARAERYGEPIPGAVDATEVPAQLPLDAYPLTGDLIADRDWWTERCWRAGVPLGRLMVVARELAAELQITPPRHIGDLGADPTLVAELIAWLGQQ